MKWLTNMGDPRYAPFELDSPIVNGLLTPRPNQSPRHNALARYYQVRRRWLSDKIIGPPKATKTMLVKALISAGMIGIYKEPTP